MEQQISEKIALMTEEMVTEEQEVLQEMGEDPLINLKQQEINLRAQEIQQNKDIADQKIELDAEKLNFEGEKLSQKDNIEKEKILHLFTSPSY